jgi:bacterial/archaeal transporter family-2 protein
LSDPRFVLYSVLGVIAGGMLAVQSVLNAALAQRVGTFASMVVLSAISGVVLLGLLAFSPSSLDLRILPRLSHAYLYLGAILGLAILATPIILVPRIGAASTLIAIVLGQLLLAMLIDHVGFLGTPKIEVSASRLLGALMAATGAFLVLR